MTRSVSPRSVVPRGPDDTDKALITALQRNGRESYASLAKVVESRGMAGFNE